MEVKKVLVVDDDQDFRYQMKIQLEAAGYQVITAESGTEARKILENTKPDIALIDLMMEQMDAGFSLAYHIKKKDSSIPVILATAVTRETGLEFDAATDEERMWVKADVVLTKPIRFEQLYRELKRLLKE